METKLTYNVSTMRTSNEDTIVSKKLLSAIFGAAIAALALSPSVFAEGQELAEMHAEMDGCEACHGPTVLRLQMVNTNLNSANLVTAHLKRWMQSISHTTAC